MTTIERCPKCGDNNSATNRMLDPDASQQQVMEFRHCNACGFLCCAKHWGLLRRRLANEEAADLVMNLTVAATKVTELQDGSEDADLAKAEAAFTDARRDIMIALTGKEPEKT